MKREIRLVLAATLATSITLLSFLGDPEIGEPGIKDRTLLNVIFMVTFVVTLRLLKKLNDVM